MGPLAGHGLCTWCTGSLKSAPNPTCPHCRVKISKTDGNKLFIDFLDPTVPDSDDIIPSGGLSEGITKQARHAKRCIDGLDAGSSVKSARAVEKNLEQLGRALEDEEGPIAVSSQLEQFTQCLSHCRLFRNCLKPSRVSKNGYYRSSRQSKTTINKSTTFSRNKRAYMTCETSTRPYQSHEKHV